MIIPNFKECKRYLCKPRGEHSQVKIYILLHETVLSVLFCVAEQDKCCWLTGGGDRTSDFFHPFFALP